MNMRKLLVVGGLAGVLVLPAGIAVATTSAPTPDPGTSASTQPFGPGNGAGLGGQGRMMGGDDRDDCPYYNSDEMQKWRDQRADRQKLSLTERRKLAQQHRERMAAERAGTTAGS